MALAGLRRLFGNGAAGSGRAVEVGWLLQADVAEFIWDAPRAFRQDAPAPKVAKSVQRCPAVLDYESRFVEIGCPIDARIAFRQGPKGEPQLVNALGEQSPIRKQHLGRMVALTARSDWRHPDRPVVQVKTPYVFLADERVWLNQMPPMLHFREPPWPGVLIGGRVPIHIWPRRLMWAFEWYRPEDDLILRRGEPWFYLRFETPDATRPVRLMEAAPTPELLAYLKGMEGVASYVRRTFSLFDVARSRRPKRLLVRRERALEPVA